MVVEGQEHDSSIRLSKVLTAPDLQQTAGFTRRFRRSAQACDGHGRR